MIQTYLNNLKGGKKAFAWLIDPDKCQEQYLDTQLAIALDAGVDLIFAGGSLISNHIDQLISKIKLSVNIPVVLFPGSPLQICSSADAVLLLSLISGRNPEYLIGNHVIAAPFLRESGLEIISTGYILVNGGQPTSVAYMSNTQPIPADKPDIAIATAIAGEMLGLKVIYLDAGSGANNPVSAKMIASVAAAVNIPLIVGGGIRKPEDVRKAYEAGADLIIVGNVTEDNENSLRRLIAERDRFNR